MTTNTNFTTELTNELLKGTKELYVNSIINHMFPQRMFSSPKAKDKFLKRVKAVAPELYDAVKILSYADDANLSVLCINLYSVSHKENKDKGLLDLMKFWEKCVVSASINGLSMVLRPQKFSDVDMKLDEIIETNCIAQPFTISQELVSEFGDDVETLSYATRRFFSLLNEQLGADNRSELVVYASLLLNHIDFLLKETSSDDAAMMFSGKLIDFEIKRELEEKDPLYHLMNSLVSKTK